MALATMVLPDALKCGGRLPATTPALAGLRDTTARGFTPIVF